MTRVLVIDDDHSLFALLSEYLGNSGFSCFHAADADSGITLLGRETWDIVILDVMLPGKSGHEVLRHMRSTPAMNALPVLMLTARGDENDKVAGLELGADDYLAKPFGPRELVARLRALLRRTERTPVGQSNNVETLQFDELVVDKTSMSLVVDGTPVQLTASELRVLELFAESPGKVIERDTLYKEILGHPPFPQDRSLDMLISRLRKKLGARSDGGERVMAVRGKGYVFLVPGDKR